MGIPNLASHAIDNQGGIQDNEVLPANSTQGSRHSNRTKAILSTAVVIVYCRRQKKTICLPPPRMSMGTPNLARNSMQPAWPSRLRLKQPRRSPDKESAPPQTTIASG